VLDVTGDGRGDLFVGQPRLDDVTGLVHLYDPFNNTFVVSFPRAGEPMERGSFGAALAGSREHHAAQSRRRLVVGAPGNGLPEGPSPKVYVYKLRTRLRGDVNNDKLVSDNDLLLLQSFLDGFVSTSDGTILDVLDYDNDGDVDDDDHAALNLFLNGPPSTTTTTTTSTTTSTVAPEEICGDGDGNGVITAADALRVLRAAVGLGDCPVIRCDTNNDGSVNAGDALRVLRTAVGLGTLDDCPQVI